VQNGVLKALSFLFEYIGEMGKDYIYAGLTAAPHARLVLLSVLLALAVVHKDGEDLGGTSCIWGLVCSPVCGRNLRSIQQNFMCTAGHAPGGPPLDSRCTESSKDCKGFALDIYGFTQSCLPRLLLPRPAPQFLRCWRMR
jgi:hypothetical protein